MKSTILLVLLNLIILSTSAQETKTYYKNGQLKDIGNYVSGWFADEMGELVYNKKPIGEWKYYYENGQLKAIGSYKKGGLSDINKSGEWKTYHDNGQLSSIGYYSNGNKIGEWKYYDDRGELIED